MVLLLKKKKKKKNDWPYEESTCAYFEIDIREYYSERSALNVVTTCLIFV